MQNPQTDNQVDPANTSLSKDKTENISNLKTLEAAQPLDEQVYTKQAENKWKESEKVRDESIEIDEMQQKQVFQSEDVQQKLNQPLENPEILDEENIVFLELIMKLISDSRINVMTPSSLVNQDIYSGLSEADQGKVDLEAVNLCSAIREIKGLRDNGFKDTYQMKNLVDRVKTTKERIEVIRGDIFII